MRWCFLDRIGSTPTLKKRMQRNRQMRTSNWEYPASTLAARHLQEILHFLWQNNYKRIFIKEHLPEKRKGLFQEPPAVPGRICWKTMRSCRRDGHRRGGGGEHGVERSFGATGPLPSRARSGAHRQFKEVPGSSEPGGCGGGARPKAGGRRQPQVKSG